MKSKSGDPLRVQDLLGIVDNRNERIASLEAENVEHEAVYRNLLRDLEASRAENTRLKEQLEARPKGFANYSVESYEAYVCDVVRYRSALQQAVEALEQRCLLCRDGVPFRSETNHFQQTTTDTDGALRGLVNDCRSTPEERSAIAAARKVLGG